MKTTLGLKAGATVFALGLLAVGASTVAANGQHTHGSRHPARVRRGHTRGAARDAALSATQQEFAVLSEPAATKVPATVTALAADPDIAAIYAPDADAAREVHPNGDPTTTWYVVPGADSLCMVVGQSGICQSMANALAGKLFIARVRVPPIGQPPSPQDGVASIVGLAPDFVTSVAATSPTGTLAQSVSSNAYELDGVRLANLTLNRASGAPLTFDVATIGS